MSTPSNFRLLVVDDEPDLRTLYELTLLREGYEVESAGTVEDAWAQLAESGFHAVITDMRLPDGTGLELLRRLEQAGRPERTIVITAYGSAENAVQALKSGAYDYLTKPVDLKRFRAVVAAALGRGEASPSAVAAPAANRAPRSAAPSSEVAGNALASMVGASHPVAAVRLLVDKVARSMAPVLVQGESGTGKELVARSIHQCSARAAQPFIAVNCGAIPEQLLEAEFFGYRKGAFTGANEDRDGFFQAARGGTLFLDEIGDLPLLMQSKLLRVIQERAVRPVGAVSEVPLDVRIVSATHKDLSLEVQAGRFRQDLFYRLNVIQIRVPALRERMDDLPLLCARVLERICIEGGLRAGEVQLSAAALERLGRHPFPGNVRELENLLYRAVALASSPVIEVEDLGLDEGDPSAAIPLALDSMGAVPVGLPPPVEAPGPVPAVDAVPADLMAYLDGIEREVLVRALELQRNNRTAAGLSLGLTLRQMRYRMARLGIHVAGEGPSADEAGTGLGA
ncbi:two-component system response regulator PilR (NtrC family) [Sphaerotilus hippei]|uniref:Two-component system response regulator PilR (NtrC family) n=1 Tax=Sphaerotilus hippei TaxID=744406 RepID=A0A318H007_9BURK|nr:sigma-54 dependent transcriptional regulator [Sphaerotilus hippei]PXW95864.1 two-component system response regulator PilR (NtrC family) [Sphaerotilus hippei]